MAKSQVFNLVLADDDDDDAVLFQDALNELAFASILSVVRNGLQLMKMLKEAESLPDILFLDLNMPLKNGSECLKEIRGDKRFKQLPVIIFSTSAQAEIINILYGLGASGYIRKPETFKKIKKVLQKVLTSNWQENLTPARTEFMIEG